MRNAHILFLRLDVVVEYLGRDVNELKSVSLIAFVINYHAFLDLEEVECGNVFDLETLKGKTILNCLLDLIVLSVLIIQQPLLTLVRHENHLAYLILVHHKEV